jgi:serine-type D-Ala-D-Ala carboxypeptidase/endopeptidase (penicillin-binding protein 4)
VTIQRRFVAIATISALPLMSGCASKTARSGAATQLPPLEQLRHDRAATQLPPVEQLRRDLAAIFTDPAIDHAQWSVAVRSIARGDVLFRQNAQRLQVPASNQKLLTAAVAAGRLGWDFRYTNRVYATGAIVGGVLNGDLIVTSDGDPTINPRHADRSHAFDDWARQLASRGLRLVSGRLIGDDNAFAEPGWGLGWSWDDIPLGYGSPVSALQYNESEADVIVSPAREAGARAIISVEPHGSGLTIDNGVTTGPPGSDTRIAVDRYPGTTSLSVRGQIAADAPAVHQSVAAANPTQQYVNALREALARQGIFIAGDAIDIDDLTSPPQTASATPLVEDRSPPLAEIVDVMMKFSRNLYAETLVRSLAVYGPQSTVRSPESTVNGPQSIFGSPATTETGLQVLRDTLLSWGVSKEGYLARDGSGLSRYDWLSADTVSTLLVHVAKDPKLGDRFRQSLAVPGEPGTLQTRMTNSPLQTRVWAKTGSMSQVRSIAGYITTVEGEPLVFSIMVNGFRVPGREIDAVMDHALGRLVEFRR